MIRIGLGLGVSFRGAGAAGARSVRTRSEFNAWATTHANGNQFWVPTNPAGVYVTVADTSGHTMWGSPSTTLGGNGFVTTDSQVSCMVRHLFPSQSLWQAQVAASNTVVVKAEATGQRSSFIGVNRNGFQSNTYGSYPTSSKVLSFIFYVEGEGAFIIHGGGDQPEPYSF